MDAISHQIFPGITESDTCYHLLADCVQDYAIYLLNHSGHVCSWNSGAERIQGYTASEIMGQHFSVFYPPAQVVSGRPMQELDQAKQQGRFETEDWRQRKDGSLFLAQVVVTPLLDEHGGLQGYAKVTRDITLYQRLEDRFRRVVEHSPGAIIMINPAGKIEMVNAQTERMFGYERAEMLNQPVEMLLPSRYRNRHAALRDSFRTSFETRPMGGGRDLFGLRKDGSEFPVEIGLNPIETETGTLVLAAMMDITYRKLAQQQIELALQEKTVLLNEIHHRVKNNLQVIISLLNMQASHVSDDNTRNILLDSQTRVRSMALIHQLLYECRDFSRVDLGDYLHRFGQLLISSFGTIARTISLNIDALSDQVYIELNRATPCGLLINELATNAFKHAYPNTTGAVIISLRQIDAHQAMLVVADHGIGMSQQPDVENTPTLGLQLVAILVEQLGGVLRVLDNLPGVRFEICFPVMQAAIQK